MRGSAVTGLDTTEQLRIPISNNSLVLTRIPSYRAACHDRDRRLSRLSSGVLGLAAATGLPDCHWRIGLAPRFFDLGRGELVFFRRFPVFFEQNPTLNRKKSFRCAKGRAFSFFSGRKKFFLSPKRASPTSSPYSPEVRSCNGTGEPLALSADPRC